MSVKSMEFYTLVCDDCGSTLAEIMDEDDGGGWRFSDEAAIEVDVEEMDWMVTEDGKHLCANCRTDQPDPVVAPDATDYQTPVSGQTWSEALGVDEGSAFYAPPEDEP